jgi:hypothetical protein
MPAIAQHPITPAAVLTPQAPSAAIPIDALFVRVGELSQQMSGLRAEREVLVRRIRTMPASGPRADLEAQSVQLTAQLTQVEMQYEATRAQIAARLGVAPGMITNTGISVPPTFIQRRGPDPDMVVGMSFALAFCIGLPLAIAYARRVWKGTTKTAPARTDESNSRLERLEHAVDAIAIEIERVAEGQRFVTKVLAERPVVASVVPPRAPSAEAQDAARGEGKPFLALGAGPMEPIRVAERQAVKQSITPH